MAIIRGTGLARATSPLCHCLSLSLSRSSKEISPAGRRTGGGKEEKKNSRSLGVGIIAAGAINAIINMRAKGIRLRSVIEIMTTSAWRRILMRRKQDVIQIG
jgi:hypothetical protein